MIRHMIHFTSRKTISKMALIAVGLFTLSACQTSGTTRHTDAVNRSTVELVRLPFAIPAEDDGTDTLSARTAISVHGFLSSINAGYGDVVMLDAPSTSGKRLAAVQQLIKDRGLTYGGVAPLGKTPEDNTVMMYVERYSVTVPNCGNWPSTDNIDGNNPSPTFGCTVNAALGLMVANPRDLIAGQNGRSGTAAAVSAITGPAATQPTEGPTLSLSVEDVKTLIAADKATTTSTNQ